MDRRWWLVVVAAATLLVALPGQASAAPVAAQQAVAATVTTTADPASAGYAAVFDGVGTGADTGVTTGRPIVVQGNVGVTTFHMKVQALQCCTVHSFVLGPWSGTWTVEDNGDTLSGTAVGVIGAGCLLVDPTGFSCGGAYIGGGVNFTLTVTGGTGRYALASGTGTLSGSQTPQPIVDPIPPAPFAGTLTLSVS